MERDCRGMQSRASTSSVAVVFAIGPEYGTSTVGGAGHLIIIVCLSAGCSQVQSKLNGSIRHQEVAPARHTLHGT